MSECKNCEKLQTTIDILVETGRKIARLCDTLQPGGVETFYWETAVENAKEGKTT